MNPNDFRREKIDGLSKHARFGLDAADTPAHDSEPVDHGGVGVRAHERVRIVNSPLRRFRGKNALGKVFQIDLMNDTNPRRNHSKSLEGLLAPLEELIPFAISLEFHFEIQPKGLRRSEKIDLHRVINYQV